MEIVVLGEKFHGLAPDAYAGELREQLPHHDVRVARTPEREHELLESATVATGSRIDPGVVDVATELELFACAYAGYGHLPMDILQDKGVTVTTASGVHAPNAAQQAIGFCLTFARRLDEGWRRKREREWRSYQTREFAGSTVCVVGLGAIGQAIVDRLAGFDVDTIGVRHSPEKGGPTDTVLGYDGLHEGLTRADYLVLCCPLTATTRGLVGSEELDVLPTDGLLVNVARGEIVDTEALVSALQPNHIGGAALDVTDPEPLPRDHDLWSFENVQITPHNAGFTPDYHERLADIVAENVQRAAETGSFENLRNQVET